MKTISIINLKGGVAKTLTADSMAHVLATLHNKRVLLVDNDKQGNTSKAFGVHSYDDKSISDVLTARQAGPAGGHQEDPVREYRRNARKYDLDSGKYGSPDGQHPPPSKRACGPP